MGSAIVFDPTAFRLQFAPTFDSASTYPDEKLRLNFDQASCFVSDQKTFRIAEKCQALLLNYVTAHVLTIGEMLVAGETPGIVKSSSVGSVSVTLEPPPGASASDFTNWLNTTPYGVQASAMISMLAAPGFISSGANPLAGFLKPDGFY